MDRRERAPDLYTALKAALEGWQAKLWTALPAQIVSFDAVAMTCQAQPTVQALMLDAKGAESWVTMPLVVDVPVLFPGSGGFTLTFPVAAGDEVLLIFSSRCIDAWWQSGGIQQQAEFRMHDLSDGFAILGNRSQPRVIPGLSTTAVQLRNDAGDAYIQIKPNKDVDVVTPTAVHVTAATLTATLSSSATIHAPTITLDGNVICTGNLDVNGVATASAVVGTVDVSAGGKNMLAHTHTGVQTGSGTSGPPT